MIYRMVAILAFGFWAAAQDEHAAHAQSASTTEMTQEEMMQAFQKQKTRGLVIAPTSQSTSASTETTTASVANAPADIATIPVDEQVNINISFDFDSAALREDQKPKLITLCNAVTAADVQVLRIVGHTDSSGSASYNRRLSKLRAEEVKRVLASECGLPLDMLEATGVGEDHPFDAADPRADVNRRVEFQALS